MARFTLTRLASLVGILLGLSVVVFLLQAVVPADPVRAMVGASATPQIVEAKRHELGLDRPLPAQYAQFLGRAVRGDLQMSLHTRRPVRTDIAAFLPATLELAATALAMAVVLGGALGLLTARGRATSLRVGLVASASVPAFLLALLLLIVFYARLRWFPGSGRISAELEAPTGPTGLLTVDGLLAGRLDVVRDALAHLALPALCLALGPAVALGRTLRSSLQTVLGSDHIRTARAKGLTERGVLLRHGVRGAECAVDDDRPAGRHAARRGRGHRVDLRLARTRHVHRPCHHQRRLPGDRRRHAGDGGGVRHHQRVGGSGAGGRRPQAARGMTVTRPTA
jgi:peptide/nickel transport system permease protein